MKKSDSVRGFFFLLTILLTFTVAVPQYVSAQPPEPFVAIHVSELTEDLETMPAVSPTPTWPGETSGYQWWYTSWHYFAAYESLKEALRSDGTPFIEVTDADIAAGNLQYPDGTPRYPILISLASEAIADNEIAPLRTYVAAGGTLFCGSSAFTRYPDGTTRADFALASEMGLHMADSSLLNWYENMHFTKTVDHRLTSHIPYGKLIWSGPLVSDEQAWAIFPSFAYYSTHYAWQVVANGATVIANGDAGPIITVKNYGQGRFIFHGEFQPLIFHGGFDPGMYSYLIYRNAIEWAFESFSLPIVKVSPWPYQYDAAFVVRHDFENNPSSIRSIESSAQFEHSVGAKGDYYFCTGALRDDMGGDPATVTSLRRAVANYGATIGSHNGGLKNPANTNLTQLDYEYWHWGPDEALDTTPTGYANGEAYAYYSILDSYLDIEEWLSGLDNGRAGCGAAGNCPRTWVSPFFNSVRDGSKDILDQLGSVTMGEQKIGPFPHWTLSYETPGKRYSHVSLPSSDWYIGTEIAQGIDIEGYEYHTVNSIRTAVDFYYNLGALINFYGHSPSNNGSIEQEYVTYSASKPRVWSTNAVGIYDWWFLRSNVVVTPTINKTGNAYIVTASVSGARDPQTAIEIALPQIQGQSIDNMSVYLDGTLATPSDYRITNQGIKVWVGSSVLNVSVQYSLQNSNLSPVVVNDSYSTNANTTLNQGAPGVLSNDTDPEGSTLTAQLAGSPTHGTLTLNANGSFAYTPVANYVGSDSFTYRASDGTTTSSIATATISVTNPVPTTTSLSPTSASAGGAAFTLTVNGTGFVSGSVVRWNGANRTTTFVSSTQLRAAITASDIATVGTASVTAFNATPGGGTSNAQAFLINEVSAVTVLNSWTNLYSASPNNTSASNLAVGNIAVGSGSRRLLLVAIVMEIGSAANPTISATYGGTVLTQIGITANSQREIVWMGYINDAQIGSGSRTLAISYSGALGNVSALHVKWASYAGINQTTPMASSAARNAGSTSVTFGSTINYVNNGMTVVVAGNGGTPATGRLTATPSFTAGTATTSNSQTSRTFTTNRHTAAGSYASSTTVYWSGMTSSRSGLVVVSLQP